MHEASLHERNCFITLTYDEKNLPEGGSLQGDHFPKFVRALRKKGFPLRYYQCGEYGESTNRPHHHACIFGQDWSEEWERVGTGSQGDPLYRSKTLSTTWSKGLVSVGALTRESAAYVARYVMKKTSGKRVENGTFERVDKQTGEVTAVRPEFATMSLKPGIGEGWIRQFAPETYVDDCCFLEGKRVPVPKYYDTFLQKVDPETYEEVKQKRVEKASTPKIKANNTPERLRVREELARHRAKRFRHRNESEEEIE